MNFDKEVLDLVDQLTLTRPTYETLKDMLTELVEFGYREGRREAFGYKAPAIGALASVLLNIETLSDGRVVIYVDDPTRCIVLQKKIPLNAKETGWHE